jgi:putative mRNA 3-end processing factor
MLLRLNDNGLYCQPGDFYIDPWRPVARAVVSHAHGDHARRGSRKYLAAEAGRYVLRARLGDEAVIKTLPYGETLTLNGVKLSFHPAGHVLGSAQVRVEYQGEVWVVSGDYKIEADPTCAPFEVIPCHTFITEATFGLPIYRWPDPAEVFAQIHDWWRGNQAAGKASLLFAYSLGKAQRLLAGLDSSIGPVYVHGAIVQVNERYRQSGVALPPAAYVGNLPKNTDWSQALILAPTSAQATPWLKRFGSLSTGFASGWMRVRGQRRRRSIDRGFVLSDHVDWPGLMQTVQATGAERILVTHGYIAPVVRWLREHGREAYGLETRFEGEQDDSESDG